jgi:hypothetical protein
VLSSTCSWELQGKSASRLTNASHANILQYGYCRSIRLSTPALSIVDIVHAKAKFQDL